MGIRKFLNNLNDLVFQSGQAGGNAAQGPSEQLWSENYKAREQYFANSVGPLPDDIQKMLTMSAVWPGGGLLLIPAPKLGPKLCVYTTFGLSNSDMPAMHRMQDYSAHSEADKGTRVSGTLQVREPAPRRPGYAGYGYEILMLAEAGQQWPVNFLQWAVNTEINHDIGMLNRVEQYAGMTVASITVDSQMSINVLITKAEAPLPTGCTLPAGKMEVLVASVIHEQEMLWSHQHGRDALLHKLQDAGYGQRSLPGRASVI